MFVLGDAVSKRMCACVRRGIFVAFVFKIEEQYVVFIKYLINL